MRRRKFEFLLSAFLAASGLLFAGGEARAATFAYSISGDVTESGPSSATYTYTLTKTGDTTLSYVDFEIPVEIVLTPGTFPPTANNPYFSLFVSGATAGNVEIYGDGIGDFGTKFGVGDTRYRVMKVNLTPPTTNQPFYITITLKGQNFANNRKFGDFNQSERGAILIKAGNGSNTLTFATAPTPTVVNTPPPPPPVISSFSAFPNPVVSGSPLTLTWSGNFTSVSINGEGPYTGNSVVVTPVNTDCVAITITYILIASGQGGITTSVTTDVVVDPQPPPPLIETTCKQIRKNPTVGNSTCIHVCLTTIDGVIQDLATATWFNSPDCTGDGVGLKIYGDNSPEKTLVCAPCQPTTDICPTCVDVVPADHPQACTINTSPSQTPFLYVQVGATGNPFKNCDVFRFEKQDQGFAAVLGTDPWVVINGKQIWVR